MESYVQQADQMAGRIPCVFVGISVSDLVLKIVFPFCWGIGLCPLVLLGDMTTVVGEVTLWDIPTYIYLYSTIFLNLGKIHRRTFQSSRQDSILLKFKCKFNWRVLG